MAVSESTLQRHWRRAVLLEWGNYCPICGERGADDELQCHHIVHRRHRLLRHDRRNGVPVHHARIYRYIDDSNEECGHRAITCHQFADTLTGREMIRESLDLERWEYIKERELRNVKDFLVAAGMSRSELEDYELKMLKNFIGGCKLEDLVSINYT